jgi:integrative and conjugative element protein (TIGR02256 family)
MIFLASGHLVILADEVVAEIKRFTAPPESDLEAGGILLGCYRGPHVEILDCTAPMRQDRRTRYGFVRRDPGHQRAALAAWNASGRTVNFVGEWHTHPEDVPSPSRVDRNTWDDLMGQRKAEAKVFVIAGRSAFYCGLGLQGRLTKMGVVADAAPAGHALHSGLKIIA